MNTEMTSLQRVLATLGHQEPDRVPLFLLLSLHGAKELGMSIKEYFSRAENVAEGQLRLRARYQHDCLYSFHYAPIEIEAWGGEVLFVEDGPPNSSIPVIARAEDIEQLSAPSIVESPCLSRVLKATSLMKTAVGDEAPIIGVVMSPFSLPVMQMGFDTYLDLIYEQPKLFDRLMNINEEFCVEWANAQLAAGATAICYFDPVSSSTIVPKELYLKTGFPIARRTLARIQGPVAIHLASGIGLPIYDYIAEAGAAVVGVSAQESLSDVKSVCKGKLSILGNLNGIEMRHWTQAQAVEKVKDAIASAGTGGGFILSDNHGEIPWQVTDETLMAISDTVRDWGNYPLRWIESCER